MLLSNSDGNPSRYCLTTRGHAAASVFDAELRRARERGHEGSSIDWALRNGLELGDGAYLQALVHGPRMVSELRAVLGARGQTQELATAALERLVERSYVRVVPELELQVIAPTELMMGAELLDAEASLSAKIRFLPRSPTIQFSRGDELPKLVLGDRYVGSHPIREAIYRVGAARQSLDDFAQARDRIRLVPALGLGPMDVLGSGSVSAQPIHQRDLDRWADDGGEVNSDRFQRPEM